MSEMDDIRRQQREKIRRTRERLATIERHAAAWDPVVRPLLQRIGEQVWGPVARLRHWHATWEVYRPVPEHPHFRVTLKCDMDGTPTRFAVKCAAGELTTSEVSEEALAEALQQALAAGPATPECR